MALTVEAALTKKQFGSPDEVRPFANGMGQATMLEIGGRMVGRSRCEPGWRWSQHVKPIAGTDSCETLHLGMIVSGSMRITMDDGRTLEVTEGDVFEIPPGHDAEVLGDEPCELIDFGDITEYAKPGEILR
ncbi:MAG: cupin domain-containing protein [Actinobacteria bacterium]|nr:cupin domain-containing protein [Actinomycetota bacterium]